jgi:hypothetical protein
MRKSYHLFTVYAKYTMCRISPKSFLSLSLPSKFRVKLLVLFSKLDHFEAMKNIKRSSLLQTEFIYNKKSFIELAPVPML